MAKKILFGAEARTAVHTGISKAARAVKVTLGPRGRNVVIGRPYGGPHITNDGVSIAREIVLEEPFENLGAGLVKEVAGKSNDGAGDGTTTAVTLLDALVSEGISVLSNGSNSMAVRAGMETAREAVVAEIRKISKPVVGLADIKQVATISAESEELGKIIAETVDKVGKDGVVTVEESQGMSLSAEVVEGLQIDKGYISPYMATNPERMEAEMREVLVLVTDKTIANIQEFLPILEKVAQSGRNEMVLIAEDVEGDALSTLVLNKMRGTFNVLAIKAPGFGDDKKQQLHDIATIVGAQVISAEVGITFESATLQMLGTAGRVVASRDNTVFVGGKGKKDAIKERIVNLKAALERSDNKFEKEKIEKRIAKLSGGVAVIHVGAATETEMKYLKDKIDDAVKATKAAMDEGVVPGGGSTLARIAKTLQKPSTKLSDDELIGYRIVLRALEEPLRQIVANGGTGDASLIVRDVQDAEANAGYDALNNKPIADMFKAGIVDPAKVTRNAVENSVSAAAIFLTTEVAVVDVKEDKGLPEA